jgi:hypothetical protein
VKKLTLVLLVLIVLFGGGWLLLRSSVFDAREAQPARIVRASPEDLRNCYDSMDILDMAIARERGAQALQTLKDRKKSYQERASAIKRVLVAPAGGEVAASEEGNLTSLLATVILATIGVLVLAIVILWLKIHRKSRETREITRRLETIKTTSAPSPLVDSTLVPPHFRTNLPNVQPIAFDQSRSAPPVPPPPAPAKPTLRDTAKQRITEAMAALKDSLAALSPTAPHTPLTQTQAQTAIRPPRRDRTIAPSLNHTRYTRPVPLNGSQDGTLMGDPQDQTNYDREAEQKQKIINWSKQGHTVSEIAKRLSIPRDQVETVIRLRRDLGE